MSETYQQFTVLPQKTDNSEIFTPRQKVIHRAAFTGTHCELHSSIGNSASAGTFGGRRWNMKVSP